MNHTTLGRVWRAFGLLVCVLLGCGSGDGEAEGRAASSGSESSDDRGASNASASNRAPEGDVPIVETSRPAPESGVVGETRRITEERSADETFARAILDAHNRVRASVVPAASPPLPPLQWDESLAAMARDWASRCPDGHRPDNDAGENLYWSGGTAPSADAAVASWAREAAYYDYRTGVCRREGRSSWSFCGHYTQLVWRDTTRLGCAVRSDCPGDFENVIVCNYDPPGNVNVTSTRIPAPY